MFLNGFIQSFKIRLFSLIGDIFYNALIPGGELPGLQPEGDPHASPTHWQFYGCSELHSEARWCPNRGQQWTKTVWHAFSICGFWYQPLEIGWLKIVQACINHRLLSSLMSTNPNSLPCSGVASAASVLCEGPWCVRSTHQLEQVSVHQWCVDLRLHEGRRTAMSTILTRFGNISFWMCLATCVKWCSVGAPLLPKNTYSIMFICMSLYVQICFVCMFRLYRGGGFGCMLTGCVRGLCKACGAWSEHVR